jgi:hypothetical protein
MTNTTPAPGNRMILLLIGGIPVTMILAATWLWFFVARGDLDLVGVLGTANRGMLVQPPRQLAEQDLHAGSIEPVNATGSESRWAMIIPVAGGRCDAACEQRLYETRQIHLAMGKEFNRLHRLYISDHSAASTELEVQSLSDGRPAPAAGDFAAYLASEHGDLQALTVSAERFRTLFAEQAEDASTWYLADPAGWVMMSYNKDVPYKDVISDLKFLLKNSGG